MQIGRGGILGSPHSEQRKPSLLFNRQWLKRRETWLVVLGVLLHLVYMLSIFDIYFKTPIVHGMDPVPPRISPPAKRLVLLVADGLRADKFYELDSEGQYRAPFLRSIIKSKGRWGVSHARPPTESRPGHVSIIAGFYEDPSAVTKGWKANPVEFDTVFNRSRHTFAFGSPDIVPIFCSDLPHSTWHTYPHEFEDFASDASFLDQWSYDQFHSLLNKSIDNNKLKQLLLQDSLVFFLHLLGCDTNGHAHRPYSSIYLNNVKVVDHIAKSVYNLVESFFKDNHTAYIFTADHGMSDKGSHGDGQPANTDTPLVAWGAGIQNPRLLVHSSHSDDGVRFVDQHKHDMPTPTEWGLSSVERVDVNQADIAPLMATLLGLPCPANSVGNLPLGYVNFSEAEEVEATLANTKQILNQFLRKSQIKQSNSIKFKPFKLLANYSSVLDQIEDLISRRDYKSAMKQSINLRSLALEGLHYFQTYDWLVLMTTVTLGYIGWMVFIILHVLQSYSSLVETIYEKKSHVAHLCKNSKKVASFFERMLYTWCFLIFGVVAALYVFLSIPGQLFIPTFIWSACWFLSMFTLMPAEIPDNTHLVVASGSIIILIGIAARWFDLSTKRNNYWLRISNYQKQKSRFPMLFHLQILLVALSSGMVWLSSSRRAQEQELLMLHQLLNWLLVGLSMVLPLFSQTAPLARLSSIFLGFAPPFLLLSIGYEALFYGVLALVLMSWILIECAILHLSSVKDTPAYVKNVEDDIGIGHHERSLQLLDVRVPLIFMVLFNVAFFGTGNFASIASFEISSVYRFITIFSPFFMAALLIFKLFIPFMLVICAFSTITKLIQVPRLSCYFLVILFSDVMTIHFFFLVQNTGSWMEIGNSISRFGIMSAQVVFVLLLFALTNIYTKDIQVRSLPSSQKAL
ncbi:hypothetical protein AAC387_Pa04g1410 [Persea americana]